MSRNSTRRRSLPRVSYFMDHFSTVLYGSLLTPCSRASPRAAMPTTFRLPRRFAARNEPELEPLSLYQILLKSLKRFLTESSIISCSASLPLASQVLPAFFPTFLSRFFSLAALISCVFSSVKVYLFIFHHHVHYTTTAITYQFFKRCQCKRCNTYEATSLLFLTTALVLKSREAVISIVSQDV